MIYAGILAGGIGSRMNISNIPKQFLNIGDKPIIIHTIEKFLLCNKIDKIYVGVNPDWNSYLVDIIEKDYNYISEKIVVVDGGKDRNSTILNIISAIDKDNGLSDEDILITHDAVRPFVSIKMIDENIENCKKYNIIDTVVPAFDTIVSSEDGKFISSIPDRKTMFQGQTPQTFKINKFMEYYNKLTEDIQLLDGASDELDMERVLKGELSPVFFGSALTNFGIETFLKYFLSMTTSPLGRSAGATRIEPMKDDFFSAFVFKIQANMNKAHRDRIAFMRICSGRYTPGMEVYHAQGGKKIRLNQSTQMMADERKIVEEAYAGDIIGVFDSGIFSIGDTLCSANEKIEFEGIPTFAPEHFARVRQIDTMKRKQFIKGVYQIAQEGAIQIFQEFNTGMEEIIVGVVGELQFEVLTYRLKSEYNVEVKLDRLPYEHIRWIENPDEINVNQIQGTSDMKKIKDLKDRPLLIFVNPWSVRMIEERNPGLKLSEFGHN